MPDIFLSIEDTAVNKTGKILLSLPNYIPIGINRHQTIAYLTGHMVIIILGKHREEKLGLP